MGGGDIRDLNLRHERASGNYNRDSIRDSSRGQ